MLSNGEAAGGCRQRPGRRTRGPGSAEPAPRSLGSGASLASPRPQTAPARGWPGRGPAGSSANGGAAAAAPPSAGAVPGQAARPGMSSERGNVARTRPQRHQNARAFKNDKYDTSARCKVGGDGPGRTGGCGVVPASGASALQATQPLGPEPQAPSGGKGFLPKARARPSVAPEAVPCPCEGWCQVLKGFGVANEITRRWMPRHRFSDGDTSDPGPPAPGTVLLRENSNKTFQTVVTVSKCVVWNLNRTYDLKGPS